jgi:hypothetical protein
MARHSLALGGRPKTGYCFGQNILPSVPYLPDEEIVPDARRSSTTFALTRCLDFGCGDTPCAGCVTADCKGSIALRQYMRENTIAVGDLIDVVYLPRRTQLVEVAWFVDHALAGFTFNIQVAEYDGAAAPVVLATGVSAAAIDWDVLDVRTINSGPLLVKTNGALQLVVTAMPVVPAPSPTDCGCPACDVLCGLDLRVAPVVRFYETGCN